MKKHFYICYIFLFMVSSGAAQVDSLPVRLAGLIYAEDTTEKTPYVHIVNCRTGAGVISDSIGFFKTTMLQTDSLVFKCLGFADKKFKLPDTLNTTILFVEIRLTKTSYYLDVVDIIALSRMNQFRYDFMKIPLPEDEWAQQLIVPGVTRGKYKWIHDNEKFYPKKNFEGPISALYYMWSDEGKSLEKLAELINNEPGDKIIKERYNLEMLSEFTGFTGDTLIDFNLYLNFSRSYLLSHDGYTILVEVKKRLPDFKKWYFTKEE